MDDIWVQEKKFAERIRLLLLCRLLVVTLLMGISLIVEVKLGGLVDEYAYPPGNNLLILSVITAAAYGFSVVYSVLLRFSQNQKLTIYSQAFCDTLTVSVLVYFTGGIESVYSLIYVLIIIYSVIFLARWGGMIVASASSITYALVLLIEYYAISPSHPFLTITTPQHDLAFIMMRLFVHFFSFYLVALVASYVVERERKVTLLLEERESAFEQLDLLHRSIIESVTTGIITVTLGGKIKLYNRAAAEITGIRQEEVLNKKMEDLFPGFFTSRLGLRNNPKGVSEKRGEFEFQKRDGHRLILGYAMSPLLDAKEVKIGEILIFQDLSQVKIMENDLERNRRMAFVGEMSAALAHEIRSPLAAISGSIQMLQRGGGKSEKEMRLMDIVQGGKEQIENFMKDFLLLARPAPGIEENVEVNPLIRDILAVMQLTPDWPENIRVELSLEDGLEIKVRMLEVRQIIWNLVLNAVQGMPTGGTLTVESKLRNPSNSSSYWELGISDTGIGIEEKDLINIMQPFFTTKDAGTGLGLTIVDRIVARYSGKININSVPGRGTVVSVILYGVLADGQESKWEYGVT